MALACGKFCDVLHAEKFIHRRQQVIRRFVIHLHMMPTANDYRTGIAKNVPARDFHHRPAGYVIPPIETPICDIFSFRESKQCSGECPSFHERFTLFAIRSGISLPPMASTWKVTPEDVRLREANDRVSHWKRWGPYVSER